MKKHHELNIKGITLIELLVGIVICGMVIAGIYRVFITQTKAYTVQDQVVEVQQSVRSAMEILLRDLRMAGFDDDSLGSTITIRNPVATPLSDTAITVDYEYYDQAVSEFQKHSVAYWRDEASSRLIRQLNVNDTPGPQEIFLENADELSFMYGVDINEDGYLDNWVSAGGVGMSKVVAVRVTLTARPVQENPDLQMVSPRTLVSSVTLRNLCLMR